jgi:hypothetical protein
MTTTTPHIDEVNATPQDDATPPSALWIVVAIVVVLLIADHAVAREWIWLRSPSITAPALAVERIDIPDWPLITNGVRAAHSFWDTRAWWYSSGFWPYHYWRPLSGLGFWTENQLFHDRYQLWYATLVISHLLFVAALGWFAYLASHRRWVALAAVAIFAAGRQWMPESFVSSSWCPLLDSKVPSDVIMTFWKDTVEAWMGI